MFGDLLFILLPLLLGYLCVVKSTKWLNIINQSCSAMVYFILFVMGVSFSYLDNLAHNAVTIFYYSALFISIITVSNGLSLYAIDRYRQRKITKVVTTTIKKLPLLLESSVLLAVVIAGFITGLFVNLQSGLVDRLSEWALYLLLLLIGMQLRNSGIALREILLNKGGMVIAVTVLISSWVGGLITSLFINVSTVQALAISSGFGWYSLSGILISDGLSPVLGGVAFISDLLREIIAIVIIPLCIKHYTYSAIGIGGATTMDVTLPVIQKSAGSEVVPMAIISGFILSVLAPICIVFFINLA